MKRNTLAFVLACTAALVAATGAQAQTVYRIVGADGKVTFSDKPPVNAEQGKIASTGIGAKTDSTGTALPFELRQVVNKYPVVLYTTAKCAPCDTGRSFLMSRGVPFSERTVSTPEDRDYLQRLTSDSSLPYLTIGSQRIKGMSDQEWTQYLDAAGYPQKSALPAAYRYPGPTPLVAVQKASTTKAEEKQATPVAEPVVNQPPPPSSSNPAGITF
jgi:glutaredoxin